MCVCLCVLCVFVCVFLCMALTFSAWGGDKCVCASACVCVFVCFCLCRESWPDHTRQSSHVEKHARQPCCALNCIMGRLTNSSVHITPSGNKRNRAALSKGRTPLFCLGRGQVSVCACVFVCCVFVCFCLCRESLPQTIRGKVHIRPKSKSMHGSHAEL